MRKLCLVILLFLPFMSGCGYILIDRIMERVESMHKEQLKHQAELASKTYTIEGTFQSGEMVEVITHHPKVEKETSDDSFSIKTSTEEVKHTGYKLTFQDGRSKTFKNVPSVPMENGTYYIVEYNGLDEVVSVVSKDK